MKRQPDYIVKVEIDGEELRERILRVYKAEIRAAFLSGAVFGAILSGIVALSLSP